MTSRPSTITPAPPTDTGPLGISCEELAELERELDLYLSFWACAGDAQINRPQNGERE
jgi:hypothetical protein